MLVMPAEAFLTIPFSLFTAHQALPWLILTLALGLSALIPGRFKYRLFSLLSWAMALCVESRCSGGVDSADAR